ncbi:hypothetical protein [Mycobacterium hubeiense]|uniref:hypothetical protein n=1 Tax=Mycobacterium hubeiense TaxID=1867256 RepID=UPI000C7F62B4|nr:hypothetical protein [Mycobacterium sp. QGD 101]
MQLLHDVLIAVHAVFGGLAFVAGLVALRSGRLFAIFLWSLVGTIASLAGAVIVGWAAYTTAERIIFLGLTALGVYMVARGVGAAQLRPAGGPSTRRYVSHLGFNLIALFDAFVVVLVLDLGGPVWLMVVAGVAIAVGGHFLLDAIEHRVVRTG